MRKFQTDHALAQADGDDAWLTRNIIRRRFHAGILTSAQVEALTVTQQAAPAKASAKESSAIRSLERLESRSRRLEKTAARQPTDARPPHVDEDESIPLALGIP